MLVWMYLALFSSAFYNLNLNLFIIKVRSDVRIMNKSGMEFGRKQNNQFMDPSVFWYLLFNVSSCYWKIDQ